MADHAWLFAPLCCGLLALVCNLILGRQVLQRGIIFIDLAMAQVAALGMLMMQLFTTTSLGLWLAEYAWLPLLGACVLALLVGALIAWLETKRVEHLEALIGIFYVLAACVAIVLVSQAPHAHEQAMGLLHGQLLWSDWGDVSWLAGLAALLLCVNRLRPNWLNGVGFYALFALSIPLLVQSLGVYLEFAMLVVPAVACTYCAVKYRALAAWLIGLLGLLAGFALSLWFDWPSGPAIVVMIGVGALLIPALVRMISVSGNARLRTKSIA